MTSHWWFGSSLRPPKMGSNHNECCCKVVVVFFQILHNGNLRVVVIHFSFGFYSQQKKTRQKQVSLKSCQLPIRSPITSVFCSITPPKPVHADTNEHLPTLNASNSIQHFPTSHPKSTRMTTCLTSLTCFHHTFGTVREGIGDTTGIDVAISFCEETTVDISLLQVHQGMLLLHERPTGRSHEFDAGCPP